MLLATLYVFFTLTAVGQTKVNYNIFSKQPLGQIQINIPQPFQFTPVDINNYSPQSQTNFPTQPNPILNNNSIEQRNQQILRQNNMLPGQITDDKRAAIIESIEQDVKDFVNPKSSNEEMEWLAKSQSYRQAYNEFTKLNPDSFSITKAVFAVENAYMDNKLSYNELTKALKERADLVKQILKRNGLNSKNNLAANYGI